MTENLDRFYLGDWHVDSGANRLRRNGTDVKLEAKVMSVLTYLARHQGEPVTREALERAVWGDTVVGYDALTGCIAKLRKVLEDDPRHPRYIETISKKGYRLVAQISPSRHASAPGDSTGRVGLSAPWFLTAGLLTVGLVLAALWWPAADPGEPRRTTDLERPTIVVFPFTDSSGQADTEYFSEGITADITTALSKLSGLFVISQPSAADWRGAPANSRHFAGALGARYILEGTVRRFEDRLRINVHLVDAASNVYLWSERYDREQSNVFAVQDDITANIVAALSVALTEDERRRIARRYTHRIDAYDDYLRGQAFYARHTPEDNLAAREYYQRAIDRDEHFARAYGSMALTYAAEHRYGWAPASSLQLDRALELAKRAIDIDEELPQAHWVLAYVHVFRKEYEQAARAARRAIQLEPNFADSYVTLAVCELHFGRADEALRLVRKAMLLNPRYPAPYASVRGQIHYFLGEYQHALPLLREATERNPNLLTPRVFLVVALSALGRQDEAAWEAAQLQLIAPNFRHDSLAGMLAMQKPEIVNEMEKHLRSLGL